MHRVSGLTLAMLSFSLWCVFAVGLLATRSDTSLFPTAGPPPGPAMGCTHDVKHSLHILHEDWHGAVVQDHERTFFVPAEGWGNYPPKLQSTMRVLRAEKLDEQARLDLYRKCERLQAEMAAHEDGTAGACIGKALERLFGYSQRKPE